MPLSKNINNYADVRAILDQLIPHKGGSYRLPSEGAAKHWRMRAYQFRRLEQELGRQRANVKGYTPATAYDMMRLTLQGRSVIIEFEPLPIGELALPTGEVIKPAPPKTMPVPKEATKGLNLTIPTTKPDQLTSLEEGIMKLIEERGDED